MKEKAKPLAVRREKIRVALEWLKAHNPLYKDIVINQSTLNELDDEQLLPVHIEHVLPDGGVDALTARYDLAMPSPTTPQDNIDRSAAVPFERVVITDVDGHAPMNELNAAAIRHMKSKGGGYIQVPHDPEPVNEFVNPTLFPMIYPSLFPYGLGGFENTVVRVPLLYP